MSDNASPRPWKIIGKDNQIVSADGKVMVPNTGYRENAELIVEAVNCHDWLKEHNRLNAEEVCKLIGERDRLRDLVRRMMPAVIESFATAKAIGESVRGICAMKGVDASEVDSVLRGWEDLIAEARKAIGEGAP